MKQRLFVTLLAASVALLLACAASGKSQTYPSSELEPVQRHGRTMIVINKVLERYHYRDLDLNDGFAKTVFETYIETLDPNRSFFLHWDINSLQRNVRRLDDDIERGKLDTAFEIFRLYRQRVDERVEYATSLLSTNFDFDSRESYRFDRSEAPWAKSRDELDEIWRKRVKNDWLGLKLAGKGKGEIRDLLERRYSGLARRVHQLDSDDVFETFTNAYASSIEPHTGYMSPSTSENFDISMRLSLEGIGAVLRAENEYTVVQRTIAGGPAGQSGQVHAGDRIVGVGQGLKGEIDEVIGWRLQDVVDRIRGPKGSVVRLAILPKAAGSDGRRKEVSLVRKQIKLEDQAAKSYIVDDVGAPSGLRIGVVEIPAFYRDFGAESRGDRAFRSTTRDVRRLLEAFRTDAVGGVVIDLRGNGGGSLKEATELTGLFIDQGPVVQVKDSFDNVEVEQDEEPDVAYAGPLAVLVDRNSASASEIFAGAIQDYGRGLIIGEPTFGKGTVQTLIELNRYVPTSREDLGRLRLTMAEFFRISGDSTQLRGVVPDIVFPTARHLADHGERSLDNPLPWEQIGPARYTRVGNVDVGRIEARSRQRVRRDPGFQMLEAQERVMRELDEETTVPLREKERRAQSDRREQALEEQRNSFLRAHGVEPVEEDDESADEQALERQREVIDRIQVDEAVRILADLVFEASSELPRSVMRN